MAEKMNTQVLTKVVNNSINQGPCAPELVDEFRHLTSHMRATVAVNISQSEASPCETNSPCSSKAPTLTVNILQSGETLPSPSSVTAQLKSKDDESDSTSLDLCMVTYTFRCIPRKLGKQDLVIKIDGEEVHSQEEMIVPSPCELIDCISPDRSLEKFSTWRLVKSGDKVYSTGNTDNMLSIVELTTKKVIQEYHLKRTVAEEASIKKVIFNNVRGIAIDDDGMIYVTGSHIVLKYNTEGKLLKWLGGTNIKGPFNDPNGIRYFDKNLYVCDSGHHRVQVLTLDLVHSLTIGKMYLEHPEDLDFDRNGSIYVLDSGCDLKDSSIVVFHANGEYNCKIKLDEMEYAGAMRLIDNRFYVTDIINHCLVVYTPGQKTCHICVNHQDSACCDQYPVGLEVDSEGRIYVSNGNEIAIYQSVPSS